MALIGVPSASAASTESYASNGNFLQLSMQEDFACGLRDDSTVWCWGKNTNNMLATGESDNFLERSYKVQGIPETQIVSLHTDRYGRIMILTAEGEVYAWGKNDPIPLGIGE